MRASSHTRRFRRQVVITKLLSPFKQFGFAAGLLYVADRLLGSFSRRTRVFVYELMVQPIPDQPYTGMRAIRAFDHREIKRGDPELASMPAPAHVIDARFAQGAICVGTFKQGKFVGYIWLAFDTYEEDEVRCTYVLLPANQSVFDFDLYIFPEFRLGLAFVAIWQNAVALLRSRGVRHSFSRLTRFNLASRTAHAHLGWKLVARAVTLKLWSFECMITTLPPYVSLSLRRRPRLALRADVLQRVSP
jgi:hypothetical protein